MNIKLTCSWCSDDVLYERFCRTYLSKLNYNQNFNFTNSNNYDWLVIINYPRYQLSFPKERTIGVIMEPSWNKHYELRYILEQKCQHILCHKKQASSQYIYYPGLLPFHLDYTSGQNLDFYIDAKFSKTKLCSFIVSYNDSTPHSNSIYKQRVDFAKKILKTDLDVDIYGNNWENSGILDQRIKGTLENKRDGLMDYKYSIAIENCIEQGYFTEKLTDCILTDTLPIYYGCPKIERYFSNVEILKELNSTNQLNVILSINKIQSNSNDKKLLATKYNLYVAITDYIKYVST